MAEEQINSDTGDRNWKETREKLAFLEDKVAEYEAKERQDVFKAAGLDPSKGVGKAVDMMFEGDLTVDNLKQYATDEFGVEFGQQDRIQDNVKQSQVEQSQNRLENIQQSSVAELYDEDVVGQIREVESKGTIRQSITAKLNAMEADKT
tara:strand:- start:63 stop:509 length:447 start_codon:yes stop_codon:yes gene_type:complete